MPRIAVEITMDKLAELINSMPPEEIETLSLLVSQEGEELRRRKEDFETGRVQFLSSEEIFKDV